MSQPTELISCILFFVYVTTHKGQIGLYNALNILIFVIFVISYLFMDVCLIAFIVFYILLLISPFCLPLLSSLLLNIKRDYVFNILIIYVIYTYIDNLLFCLCRSEWFKYIWHSKLLRPFRGFSLSTSHIKLLCIKFLQVRKKKTYINLLKYFFVEKNQDMSVDK